MRYAVLLLSLILTACTSSIPINIDSQPQGAKIYCNGKLYGETPSQANFEVNFWLPPSSLTVILKKEGFISHSERIVPTPVGDGRVYWPDEKFIRLVPKKE